MTKSTIIFGVVGSLLLALFIGLAIKAHSSAEEPAEQSIVEVPLTPSDDDEPDADDATDDDHGQMTGPADEQGDSRDSYLVEDMPDADLAKAKKLARAWVTFDTADDESKREKDLGKVISNPQDWADHMVATSDVAAAVGNPTFHTKSYAESITVPENLALAYDGKYEFIAQMRTVAEHRSGGGTDRGTTFGTMTWKFTVTPDWELLDVVEPDPR